MDKRIALRRRLRLRMLGIIAASYGVDAIILLLYAVVGTTTMRVPLLFAAAAAVICVAFALVLQTKLGERAYDPFLSIWQMTPGTIMMLAFMVIAPEVGFVFLTVLFIIFGFGALRLAVRTALVALAATAAGVAIILGLLSVPLAIPARTPAERWITGLFFVLALARCMTTGLLGSVYRQQLFDRSAALKRLTSTLEEEVAQRTQALARANEKLEVLVAERTAEIKILQGTLPICSHCKKIRDEKGAWNMLEEYISARSDVLFSHGLCSDCLRKHYPDYAR